MLLVKCLLTAQLHSLHIRSIVKFLRNQVQEPMITKEIVIVKNEVVKHENSYVAALIWFYMKRGEGGGVRRKINSTP